MLAPNFLEQASQLSKETRAKIIKCLQNLSSNIKHPGLQTKKIKGARNTLYECRVDKEVRLVYDQKEGYLRCWWIGHHDPVLKYAVSEDLIVDDIEIMPVPFFQQFLDTERINCEFFDYEIEDLANLLI
jgi:mRNA-degrading endonuclease YafQ of YafQ-DinJ toxin-antitoxin module